MLSSHPGCGDISGRSIITCCLKILSPTALCVCRLISGMNPEQAHDRPSTNHAERGIIINVCIWRQSIRVITIIIIRIIDSINTMEGKLMPAPFGQNG